MKKTITMSIKDFLEEHKRLISRLRNPTPEDLEDEAKKQEEELKEYDLDLDSSKSAAKMPLNELKNDIQAKTQSFRKNENLRSY